MKTTEEKDPQVGHDEIARLARRIWEQQGQKSGHDLEYWLQAERQLRSAKHGKSEQPDRQTTVRSAPSPRSFNPIRLPDSRPEPARS